MSQETTVQQPWREQLGVSGSLTTKPELSIPSIGTSAMLVELSISTWTGRKLDKRASQDVTATNYAEAGIANVHKKLLGHCDELTAVQKFTANVRNVHSSMTMPWSDLGSRLLPTTQYFKYHKQMTELQVEYDRLKQQFLDAYEQAIIESHERLGKLFSYSDYPSGGSLAGKFKFRFSYIPLPDAGDFRVDVGAEGNELVRDHYQSYYSAMLTDAMNDVWKRAYKALSKMSERLDYDESEQKKVFRDTLVSNVVDLVDLLDVCNVTGDSQMSAMRLKLDDALRGITPDALREDEYLRGETKLAVDRIIKSLPSLDDDGFVITK